MAHGGESPFGVRHLEAVSDWLKSKYGVNTGIVFAILGILLIGYFFATTGVQTNRILAIIIGTSPLWLPFTLFFLFFESWMYYIQTYNKLKLGRVSLEILLPQEVFKSPVAMENILTQLFQKASPDNLVDTYWAGKHPPYFGLEIISTGGKVSFVVNTPNVKYRRYVETSFYSQYPGIEIREMPVDYTAAIPWDPDTYGYMPIHFGKRHEGEKMGLPIKTYVDFGLDKDPKKEFEHSPLSTLLELLASLKPGEHMWFQYLIRIHRTETFLTGSLFGSSDWRDGIQTMVEEIMGRDKDEEVGFGALKLTDAERDQVKALERAKTKFPFKVYPRVFYISRLDSIDWDRIGHAITIFQESEQLNHNSIRYKWRADYDWNWWQDPSGRKRLHLKKAELEDYKKRRFESRNGIDHGAIMTTEEIATLFHLPGSSVTTPSLARIPSKRGEAPSNLPIG